MSVFFARLIGLPVALCMALFLFVSAGPVLAQDAPIPSRATIGGKNKFVPNAEYAEKIARRMDEGLLAVFPPDGFSGVQFKGQTTVIPAGDRFAINLPSVSILKPDLGLRFDVGDISLTAKILVDPTVEDNWRFDVSMRLPSMILVRDAVSNEEQSRILIGKHDIDGTFELKGRFFSMLKISLERLTWQQETKPDPTDPDYTKPDYRPKPRIMADAKDLNISTTLGINAEGRLSGPLSIKMAQPRLHQFQTGSRIFAADDLDVSGEVRQIDLQQYSGLVHYLGEIFTVGIQGYKSDKPKIDEIKRSLFFDDLATKIKSVKPLLDGFDVVLTLNNPDVFISDTFGTISAQNLTFGLVVGQLMTGSAQIGLRIISSQSKVKPALPRPDLFPQNLDFRINISDIASSKLWSVFTDLPTDMKIYGEVPSLDYAWNKFFYQLAINRASIVVDKSTLRSKDLDAEFVMRGQFIPSAAYLFAGVANANLIGIDELAAKTAKAANNIIPSSVVEQATRKRLYELSKMLASLRDAGNRGLQREKGMTRRYNVAIEPSGAVVFSSNNGAINIVELFPLLFSIQRAP